MMRIFKVLFISFFVLVALKQEAKAAAEAGSFASGQYCFIILQMEVDCLRLVDELKLSKKSKTLIMISML